MALSAPEFEFLRQLVRKDAGIVLDAGKEYLVETRLAGVVRQHGLSGFTELVTILRARPFDPLRESIKEAMTTNETSFFRDIHPFDALRTQIIPELIKARAAEKTLSLWCAAASSGQEPYSVMMLLRQHFPQLADWDIRFLCTDLSKEMIDRCTSGRYSQLEVNRGLPAPMLVRWFRRDGAEWVVDPSLRQPIDFRTMNLIEPWPAMRPVDLVMIRNVLIYFDVETKQQILGRIRQVLRPDGYLMLGSAETTLNIDDAYERIAIGRSSTYQPRAGRAAGRPVAPAAAGRPVAPAAVGARPVATPAGPTAIPARPAATRPTALVNPAPRPAPAIPIPSRPAVTSAPTTPVRPTTPARPDPTGARSRTDHAR